ncbi:uncharacterized protein NDAI_0A07550 [Naumovozyma dairenensis CBS 421]|uniref:Uncharacterized protein n=1 Tax=Naumovozyma dairenensis (strain ATCC 10597 / BCRC 20456 / CBS 421 / NBRC 0211 / NRRL Y-12639) TaxID=1071378 RepID=G0W521_NAUDC|nr:hypothetical protein NDAI_0A07550 [Naumovozyma dairenensis CBS 421]CCD22909.1 hypothetical protein NDAI_0A07550 [Naumovozyma dairenensis CBS 421]
MSDSEDDSLYERAQLSSITIVDLSSENLVHDDQGCPLKPIGENEEITVPIPKRHVWSISANIVGKRQIDKERGDGLDQAEDERPRKYSRQISGAVIKDPIHCCNDILTRSNPQTKEEELLLWQLKWKKILKEETVIYFDTKYPTSSMNRSIKMKLDKKKNMLKNKFLCLNTKIMPYFDNTVTLILSERPFSAMPELFQAFENRSIKVWDYEKALRFFQKLEIDVSYVMSFNFKGVPLGRDNSDSKSEIFYLREFRPYLYIYDFQQIWAPLVKVEWDPKHFSNMNALPYPTLKYGTYGSCPFVDDGRNNRHAVMWIVRRYERDMNKKKYAMRLRQLYCNRAKPLKVSSIPPIIPHTTMDSKKCVERLRKERDVLTLAKKHQEQNNTSLSDVYFDSNLVRGINELSIPDQHFAEIIGEHHASGFSNANTNTCNKKIGMDTETPIQAQASSQKASLRLQHEEFYARIDSLIELVRRRCR